MKLSNKKQIKTNYKAQLLINLLFEDEIEKKNKTQKLESTQANPANL
jgi:stalled ribosome alternative rescue factor ArfA